MLWRVIAWNVYVGYFLHIKHKGKQKLWIWTYIETLEGSEHDMCDNIKYK